MSVISRLKTWVNEILTASDLNAEFDNVVTGINNLLATSITNGDITHAPDGNSVFDALALKAPLISPSFTTPALGTPASGTLTNCTGLPPTGLTVQPVLTNLLTNSQWVATSGSTLCEVISGAAPVTDGANAALVNNLLTNGGFDSATTGWTVPSGSLASAAGGKTGNQGEFTGIINDYFYQAITTVVGKLYQLGFYVKKGTANSGNVYVGTSVGGSQLYASGALTDADWTLYTKVFEATATTIYITGWINSGGAGTTMGYDSITLYEVTPGYVAADTLAPDGWDKTSGVQIWRQYKDATYTKEGSFYSLKVTGDGSAGTVFWSDGGKAALPEFYYKYAGTPQAFAMWVWCASASKARIGITDSAGTTWSSYHSGGSTWEWLEVTRTPATSITSFKFVLDAGISTTAYFSHDMGVHGSSIGQGNYQPIPNEVIWLQIKVASTLFAPRSASSEGPITVNLEADTSGKLGKGTKSFYISGFVRDSGSAATGDNFMWLAGDAGAMLELSCGGLTNDAYAYKNGWQNTNSSGDYQYQIYASGAATFDAYLQYCAIQT